MFKKAFTLSEVLIVIAVIGIASALTIPNVIDSYKEEHTIAKLQKVYGELQSAQQQCFTRYGEYENWYASNISTTNRNTEDRQRLVEFLEVSQSNVTFPIDSYNSNTRTNVELKDGTYLSIWFDDIGHGTITVGTDGNKSTTYGKNIFSFGVNMGGGARITPTGTNITCKANNDFDLSEAAGSASANILGTAWALTNGNLDYLKCASSLNWETKTTCD